MENGVYYVKEKETGKIMVGLYIMGELVIGHCADKRDYDTITKVPKSLIKMNIRNMKRQRP